MNEKFRLNVMTSKIHILVICRGYFRFAEKKIGLEELQKRETYPVMKESFDPSLSLKIITVLVEIGHISESLFKTKNTTQPNQKLFCFLTNFGLPCVFLGFKVNGIL